MSSEKLFEHTLTCIYMCMPSYVESTDNPWHLKHATIQILHQQKMDKEETVIDSKCWHMVFSHPGSEGNMSFTFDQSTTTTASN